MAQRAQDLVLDFVASVRRDPRKQYSAIAVAALTSLVLGRAAWKDYKLYRSYGPGGLPSNVFGWTVTNILRLIGIDMTDVSKAEKDADQRSWLGEGWPSRKSRDGSRPSVGPHPIPQRQLDQHGPKDVQQVCTFVPTRPFVAMPCGLYHELSHGRNSSTTSSP